ncbi:MAG: helix-turn-helix domain-containing protein [Clostridiales bacterium]
MFAARLLARHLDWLDKQKRLGQLQQDIKRLEDVIIYDDNKGAKNRLVERSLLDHFLRGCDFADIMTIAEQNFLFPLALYNLFLEKISGTETSSNKQLPDNILDLQVMQELIYWKTPRSAMVQGEILHLYPVLCGETLRGFIACWTPNKEFTDVQSDLLEIICRAAACIWVKMTAVNEANQHLKSELLTGILSGKQNDELLNKSQSLGLYNENMFFVILIACPEVENHISYSVKSDGQKLMNYLAVLLNNNALNSIVVPERNDICIIASYKNKQRKNNRYDNVVREVMYKIYEDNPNLLVSGGRIYPGIFNIRKTYWEANQCMVIINKYFIHRKVVNYGDVGILRLLLTQKKEDIDSYLEDILGPIIEYDRKKNADLMTTLFYYSRFNQSSSYVAHKLNIHANTLYQRIKKAEELMGYDFENPMDWLDVQTASIMYGLIYTDLITKL